MSNDTQSLIRLLLYANDIDIEGIAATTSVHKKTAPAPASIRRVIANKKKELAEMGGPTGPFGDSGGKRGGTTQKSTGTKSRGGSSKPEKPTSCWTLLLNLIN